MIMYRLTGPALWTGSELGPGQLAGGGGGARGRAGRMLRTEECAGAPRGWDPSRQRGNASSDIDLNPEYPGPRQGVEFRFLAEYRVYRAGRTEAARLHGILYRQPFAIARFPTFPCPVWSRCALRQFGTQPSRR